MTDADLLEPPELFAGPFVQRRTGAQHIRFMLHRLGLRGLARAVRRAVA